jgi:hypothetical protein
MLQPAPTGDLDAPTPSEAPHGIPPVLPTIGRIVHYVLKQGPRAGAVRAAIVTNAFGGPRCNGTVFIDQANDRGHPGAMPWESAEEHFCSAPYDGGTPEAAGPPPRYEPGTWHWPPRT